MAIHPFVTYSSFSSAQVPPDDWAFLYSSLQALKAHVQEYPGCQRFDVFFRAEAGGTVRLHCYTTWDTLPQLEAFLERGYTFERCLEDTGGNARLEDSRVMEKVF